MKNLSYVFISIYVLLGGIACKEKSGGNTNIPTLDQFRVFENGTYQNRARWRSIESIHDQKGTCTVILICDGPAELQSELRKKISITARPSGSTAYVSGAALQPVLGTQVYFVQEDLVPRQIHLDEHIVQAIVLLDHQAISPDSIISAARDAARTAQDSKN